MKLLIKPVLPIFVELHSFMFLRRIKRNKVFFSIDIICYLELISIIIITIEILFILLIFLHLFLLQYFFDLSLFLLILIPNVSSCVIQQKVNYQSNKSQHVNKGWTCKKRSYKIYQCESYIRNAGNSINYLVKYSS